MESFFKNGSSWRVQVRVDGRVRSKSFDTKKDAGRWASEIETFNAKGKLPGPEAERTSLAEALERYRSEITPTKRGAKIEGYRI